MEGQEASEGSNISSWARDLCCDVLEKTVAAFCPCPVHLSGVKVKSNPLIFGVEGTLPNIEADAWSLVTVL